MTNERRLTGQPFFQALAQRNFVVARAYLARAEKAKQDREARGAKPPRAIRTEGG